MVAHSAAGKLQGLTDDRVWYELAYVAGVTNGLNAVADGLDLPLEFAPPSGAPSPFSLTESDGATSAVKDVPAEIAAFYAMERSPAIFRWMARDPRLMVDQLVGGLDLEHRHQSALLLVSSCLGAR